MRAWAAARPFVVAPPPRETLVPRGSTTANDGDEAVGTDITGSVRSNDRNTLAELHVEVEPAQLVSKGGVSLDRAARKYRRAGLKASVRGELRTRFLCR